MMLSYESTMIFMIYDKYIRRNFWYYRIYNKKYSLSLLFRDFEDMKFWDILTSI